MKKESTDIKTGEVISQEKFNSITNAKSVENQNQEHNIKKQALGPNTKR